ADLTNRSIRFDPELDLEPVPELPGKQVLQDTAARLGESLKCSKLIQDSHGWCFYIHADDERKYLIELTYRATHAETSSWVLACSRCSGLRPWEWFHSPRQSIGMEQTLLDQAVGILISHHGFERHGA